MFCEISRISFVFVTNVLVITELNPLKMYEMICLHPDQKYNEFIYYRTQFKFCF